MTDKETDYIVKRTLKNSEHLDDSIAEAVFKIMATRDEQQCELFRKLIEGGSFELFEQQVFAFPDTIKTKWWFDYRKDDDGSIHAVSMLLTENRALSDRIKVLNRTIDNLCRTTLDEQGNAAKAMFAIQEAGREIAKEAGDELENPRVGYCTKPPAPYAILTTRDDEEDTNAKDTD